MDWTSEELERASAYQNFQGCRDGLKVLMLRCIEAESIEDTQAAWAEVENWTSEHEVNEIERREIDALHNNVKAIMKLS